MIVVPELALSWLNFRRIASQKFFPVNNHLGQFEQFYRLARLIFYAIHILFSPESPKKHLTGGIQVCHIKRISKVKNRKFLAPFSIGIYHESAGPYWGEVI